MLQKRVCTHCMPVVLAGAIICLVTAVGFCDSAEGNAWIRHKIDDLPQRAMFIQAGDLDNDGRKDLIAGGWWWKNPGDRSRGKFNRQAFLDRNLHVVKYA